MKRVSGIIFCLLFAGSAHYALLSPQHGPLPFLGFLIAWSAFITGLVMYGEGQASDYFAVMSALTFAGMIRLFYKQFPGVLVGPSYQPSYRTLRTVVEMRAIRPEVSAAADAQYPGTYIMGAVTSIIGDVSVFATVQWLGAAITLGFLVFVFLAGRHLFGVRAATLAVVVLAVFPRYVFTHSSFIKETLGIVFVGLILYGLILRLGSETGISQLRWVVIMLAGIAGVAISHHLAAAIALLLIVILSASQFLSLPPLSTRSQQRIAAFNILACTVVVSFWLHVQQSPLILVVTELLTALAPSTGASSESVQIAGTAGAAFSLPWRTLWSIAWNASFILGPLAGVAGVFTALYHPAERRVAIGLLGFGGLMAVFTLVLTVFSSASSSGAAWGGRFVVYGLATLYLVAAAVVVDIPRFPAAKPVGAILLISVLVVQGFATPPSLYMDSQEPIDVDPHSYYSQPSEKNSVDWAIQHSQPTETIEIDLWLLARTGSLYDEATQSRLRRLRQCGRRDVRMSVTSKNALPNSPTCGFSGREKVYDSGTGGTTIND